MLGLISDVHSNLYGLTSVIGGLQECDVILCAGDITGYYTFVNEVFDVLEQYEVIFVCGNHDNYLLRKSFSGFPPLLRNSLEYTKAKISENNLKKLKNSSIVYKEVFDGVRLEMCHEDIGTHSNVDLVVHGHTHIPLIRRTKRNWVVNPGSCGQPRDGDARASYGVFYTEDRRAVVNRVAYNIDRVIKAGEEEGIHHKFIEALNRERGCSEV